MIERSEGEPKSLKTYFTWFSPNIWFAWRQNRRLQRLESTMHGYTGMQQKERNLFGHFRWHIVLSISLFWHMALTKVCWSSFQRKLKTPEEDQRGDSLLKFFVLPFNPRTKSVPQLSSLGKVCKYQSAILGLYDSSLLPFFGQTQVPLLFCWWSTASSTHWTSSMLTPRKVYGCC